MNETFKCLEKLQSEIAEKDYLIKVQHEKIRRLQKIIFDIKVTAYNLRQNDTARSD